MDSEQATIMVTGAVKVPPTPYWQPKLNSLGETVTGLEEVAQAIALLFATLPGSVPLLPEYGFNWLAYLDRPMGGIMRRVERDMIKALRRWEQRVEVVSVKAEPLAAASGNAIVCLTWKLKGGNDAVVQILGLAA